MKQKPKKVAVHQILVRRSLCADEREARALVMAGKVIVDGRRVDKAGKRVAEDADVRVKGIGKYVGRGGLKLEGALADFAIDVSGKVALDSGASTGGFTDCLLQHGAARVYAVDAGFGALAGALRADPRVVNMEKTNIGDLAPEDLDPRPMLATVDLSYLSLRKGIPIVAPLLAPGGEMICLVKPLFEIDDPEARRSGRIGDPAVYAQVLRDLIEFVDRLGFAIAGLTHSHITGSRGTHEFFLRISLAKTAPTGTIDIEGTVAAALAGETGNTKSEIRNKSQCSKQERAVSRRSGQAHDPNCLSERILSANPSRGRLGHKQ